MWFFRLGVFFLGLLLILSTTVKGQKTSNAGPPELKARSREPDLEHLLIRMGALIEQVNLDQEALFERLLREIDDQHPLGVIVMDQVGSHLYQQGKYAAAQEIYERAIRSAGQIWGEDHLATWTLVNSLASTLKAQGDLATAVELEEQVLEIRRSRLGKEHPKTLTVMNNLAQTIKAQGNFIAARKLEEQALAIRRRRLGDEHPDTLTLMNNLALTLNAQGDLATARELEEWVLEVSKRLLGEEDPKTLTSMNSLANTLYDQGDHRAAKKLFKQALEVSRRVLGGEHPDTLRTMNNLAQILFDQGYLTTARDLQEKVLEVSRRGLGESHPHTLAAMSNLSVTLYAQGAVVEATDLELHVLKIRRRHFGQKGPDILTSLNNLAGYLRGQGDLVSAIQLYEEAVSVRTYLNPPNHEPNTHEEVVNLSNLASSYQASNRFEEAYTLFLRSMKAIESLVQIADISEDVKSRCRWQYRRVYQAAIDTATTIGYQEEAFSIAERYRAQSLLTLLFDKDLASRSKIPFDLEEQLQTIITRYEATFRERDLEASVAQRDEAKIAELILKQDQLRRKRDVLEGKIRQAVRGGDWQPPKELPLEKIRQALDPGTLLISYNVADKGLNIFLVSNQKGLETHRVDVKRLKLTLQVRNFFGQIHEKSSSKARHLTASWLYEKLLKPIADRIEASDRLLILPDELLHFLPFAVLARPTGKDTWQYLVEWKPLHLAASATVYAELLKKRQRRSQADTKTWDLVAFGDPIYPQSKVIAPNDHLPTAVRAVIDRGIFDGGLDPLPYTHRELTEIGRLFPKDTTRIHFREDALEKHARDEIPNGRIVHFATHGFADPNHPAESFLILTIPKTESEHNGILQAWEIRHNLRLQADLVVLSACRTAFGSYHGGEGLMSLSRTFQIAGARTVVASLWNVNDVSTAELMIRFYRHLIKEGKSKDEALQAAQLELIRGPIETVDEDGNPVTRDFSAPYYWAAFQVIGDRL